jgi:hypothetical protein
MTEINMAEIKQRLESIAGHTMRLANPDADGDVPPHKPTLRVWVDNSEMCITLTVGPLMGHQTRYVDLTPTQARMLAKHLTATADAFEIAIAGEQPAGPVDSLKRTG